MMKKTFLALLLVLALCLPCFVGCDQGAEDESTSLTDTQSEGVSEEASETQSEDADETQTEDSGDKQTESTTETQSEKDTEDEVVTIKVTIEKVEYDEEGRLIITLSDGTVFDPVELPSEHNFGAWVDYTGNSEVPCESRLFYRTCTICKTIEWKTGSYKDHKFNVVTTKPTCYSEGYDDKTCTKCGFEDRTNYTEKVAHKWESVYSYDKNNHWYECTVCDAVNDKEVHTVEDSGMCSVCNNQITASRGVVYIISDDGTYAEVIDYTASATMVRIAEEYEGVPVTGIAERAFAGKEITSVIIPDSVTSIGNEAFYQCYSLASVTIGNGVTSIGDYAFYDCSSLTSVVIGDSVTSIGGYAFEYCSSLTSVTMGAGVKSIGCYAFYDCYYIESVHIQDIAAWCEIDFERNYSYYCSTNPLSYGANLYVDGELVVDLVIPEGVTSISQDAFRNCSTLTSIVIPSSVTSIGSYAFYGCNFIEVEGGVSYVDKWVIGFDNTIAVVELREDTVGIADEAFYEASKLRSITIPDSVTSISSSAFSGCSSLSYNEYDNGYYLGNEINPYVVFVKAKDTSITTCTVNEDTKVIYPYAFYNCDSLTSIEIPNSVTSIGSYAFYNCDSLTSIEIGDGVTSIGYDAFYDCSSLTEIIVEANNANYCSINGNLYSKDETELIQYAIGKTATSFVIPDSVTGIGDGAFSRCSSLTSVVIGDSVTSIGNSAFYYCSSLTSVVIGDSVTSIGNSAFYYCSSLTSVVIGDSVTSIGNYAFYNCSSLTSIDYGGTISQWENIDKISGWDANDGDQIEVKCTDGTLYVGGYGWH